MPLIQVAIIIMLAHVNGYPSVCIRKTSDVNKTFCQDSLNLKTKTKTLFFVLEAPRDQDCLVKTKARLYSDDHWTDYHTFLQCHKMNPTVYTHSDTTHRCRGADYSFWVQSTTVAYPGFL